MTFLPATTPPVPDSTPARFLLFRENQILLREDQIPELPSDHPLQPRLIRSIYLGTLNGQPCYTGELSDAPEPGMTLSDLRGLHGRVSDERYALVNHASQIVTWDLTHQFCPKCGTAVTPDANEKCKICSNCGLRSYPRISPCIIVSVTRGKELLMLRAPHFPEGLFSVVAGFVEAGENLETAVAREIREETGVEVKNIRYHSSQAWSFPHSLMVGFTAEYAGGTLTPCPVEVEEIGWYTPDRMPSIPPQSSIARRLIDDFLAANND